MNGARLKGHLASCADASEDRKERAKNELAKTAGNKRKREGDDEEEEDPADEPMDVDALTEAPSAPSVKPEPKPSQQAAKRSRQNKACSGTSIHQDRNGRNR